jgi:hypothetical protein
LRTAIFFARILALARAMVVPPDLTAIVLQQLPVTLYAKITATVQRRSQTFQCWTFSQASTSWAI